MFAQLSEDMRSRVTLAAVGLVQGFVYYLSYEFWPDGAGQRAVVAAVLFFVSAFALIFQLSWAGKDVKRQLVVTTVLPLVFAFITFWVWLQIPVGEVPYRSDGIRAPSWIAGAVVTLFLVTPFIQIFLRSGRRVYPYEELFNGFWNNLFTVAVGGMVIGAFWAVIMLWSELFKLIDVTFFEDVFTGAAFVCLSLATVFGYALALGREWEKLATTSRNLLLMVLKALMPLLAVIALLFLVSLPFTGLQPLWDTRHASATLLALIGVTILFFNGAYRDGIGEPPYSPWVRRLVEAALITIPLFAAITFYALFLRIDQYGLTLGRFYGVLFATAGMLCGLGYAMAVFKRSGEWMDSVPTVNMRMAWIVVVCAVLAHTALLDPMRWSARNQFRRISAGDVDAAEFDFGYLRFELGHIGFETLERIEGLNDHPQANIIAERIRATREAESYSDVRPQPETLLAASDIFPLDTTTALPDSLVRYVVTHLTQFQADACEANGDCTLFPVNLDNDEAMEFVLLLSGDRNYSMLAYDLGTDGRWEQAGQLWRYNRDVRLPPRTTLLETLNQNGASTAQADYRDLVIGELRLRVIR
jgi:hypothetical protein